MIRSPWVPPVVLSLGVLLVTGLGGQPELPLRRALDTSVPQRIGEYAGRDVDLPGEERRVSGVSDYLLRVYSPERRSPAPMVSLYVGYYASQTRGRTIHSPRNCLPGAGWEVVQARRVVLSAPSGALAVNRSVIQRGEARAVVLYWYQGRGRTEADEYRVKWNLLRDSLLRRRSDEALVRIMVPVNGSEEHAYRLAAWAARSVVSGVTSALPI